MVTTKRSKENPLLSPDKKNPWEAEAAFHGTIIKTANSAYKMLYRAVSIEHLHRNKRMKVSSIGSSQSGDGIHFKKRSLFLEPSENFDTYGCEDPRVTYIDGRYYVFYTAISNWPPDASSIRAAVATTNDMEKILEKHLVTPFNAKAMTMFPEKINDKYVLAFTAHTDSPPAKICIRYLDSIEDLWDSDKWSKWHEEIDSSEIPIYKTDKDHIEIGSSPIKTEYGWLMIFCYIQNYFSANRVFRIDAVLLDHNNPQKILGQTLDPLIIPETQYESYGMVPNTIFPSSAIIEEGQIFIYYSACDTTVCRASITLNDLIDELLHNPTVNPHRKKKEIMLRSSNNPIISPVKEHAWESKYTFNAGSLLLDDKIHILYRAMGDDDTSVLGHAISTDGISISYRSGLPVYTPRESFEIKYQPGFSGCEDPRLTRIEDTVYMCYTAYNGINPPRIALTLINKNDFASGNWNWSTPKLISSPDIDNKDSCIVSEKISGKYVIFHRIPPCIWVDFVTDLDFSGHYLGGHPLMGPRVNSWDNLKIGLNGPPEKTKEGWLLLYHGVSKDDDQYRMGAALLDIDNPMKIIARLHNPILEPKEWYENEGYRKGTIFSNGQVIKDGILYVYYGGADKYLGVASCPLDELLDALKKGK